MQFDACQTTLLNVPNKLLFQKLPIDENVQFFSPCWEIFFHDDQWPYVYNNVIREAKGLSKNLILPYT